MLRTYSQCHGFDLVSVFATSTDMVALRGNELKLFIRTGAFALPGCNVSLPHLKDRGWFELWQQLQFDNETLAKIQCEINGKTASLVELRQVLSDYGVVDSRV